MELFSPTTIMSFFLGIGLAASAGFRVFVPLFALSLFAHFGGNIISLNESWQWIGSWPAIITLGVATAIEVFAYYIPVVDNLLDTFSVPAAAIAGTMLMVSTLNDMNEVGSWALAIIAGGGTASVISMVTSAVRVFSTGATAATGNFLVNSTETAASSILSLTALIWAPIAFVLVLISFFVLYKVWKTTKTYFLNQKN